MAELGELFYDKTDPISIENYGKAMVGKTFTQLVNESIYPCASLQDYGNPRRKGGLGNLVEEAYFGYSANSEANPDFIEAGVELKATPYEQKKNGELRAGERLVLGMIDYKNYVIHDYYSSHAWAKGGLMLLVYYWRNKSLRSKLDNVIEYVKLFTPPAVDRAIIEADYKKIIGKIEAGKAHELSEGDTMYLGACTKGATAEKSIVKQFYPPYTPAKRRAYCYKQSYMTYVLNNFIVKNVTTYAQKTTRMDAIVSDADELRYKTFEELVEERINGYMGLTDKELCRAFHIDYNIKDKGLWSRLAYRMLGIKSNNAEEFVKAGIKVKAIRIEENGSIEQHMSFPVFKYKEIIEEEWDTSRVHEYFSEMKLLFVVYKRNNDCYELKGCQLWNMPYEDLEVTVHNFWNKVVDTIKVGVKFTFKTEKSGRIKVLNNFPGINSNRVTHIRPHASKRYFRFNDGTVIGDESNKNCSNELPDGTWMPNYCFWLNNSYIIDQLKNSLKE